MTDSEIKYWLMDVMVDQKVYSVTPEQADQIKDLWEELHAVPGVYFSFNEGCTKIKKHDDRKVSFVKTSKLD